LSGFWDDEQSNGFICGVASGGITRSEKFSPQRSVKRKLESKKEMIVLRMRKLLPKFYVEKCYDVLKEIDLFSSNLKVEEYAFF